ncbi:hypothetical protein B0H17DRAFT_646643 [Mycena rosella]|uniref:Uncharacterized protein n=1 Tax=Mycena rosella TaxID=1033263 RepID=A0AAD7DFF8_MYCRO|nr:hypothetical protein B0H17DRAFT_646643 [Mycena rosella]
MNSPCLRLRSPRRTRSFNILDADTGLFPSMDLVGRPRTTPSFESYTKVRKWPTETLPIGVRLHPATAQTECMPLQDELIPLSTPATLPLPGGFKRARLELL